MIDHDSFLIWTLFQLCAFLLLGCPEQFRTSFYARIGRGFYLDPRNNCLPVASDGRLAEVNSKLNGDVTGLQAKTTRKNWPSSMRLPSPFPYIGVHSAAEILFSAKNKYMIPPTRPYG
ncbi:hypothetical protein B0H14DRAFT_3159836 [Mycena olivaceomarginata]|nr:hypothetical protein B0H14DRAFT_3159836 [Mycena olivaceomarginata]